MGDDMISKLPDVLIQKILSSLSMDEAVRSSILSKRWEFLWTSFPNLVFDVRDEEDVKFVNRALFLRESRIKKFSICLNHYVCSDSASIHLKRWITDTVRLHVDDLQLNLFRPDPFGYSFEFPNCLFTCASLTSFSLRNGWNFRLPNFRLPFPTNLSNLKKLVLEYVYFADAQSVDNLFNGCPMLETASLIQCSYMCNTRISAPKLYELVIMEPRECTEICHDIMIFGPSLKSFRLRGYLLNSYCFNDQPLLDEVEISIKYGQDAREWEGFVCRFYKLLKGLPLVKKLFLSSQVLEALSYQGNGPADVPFFNNLSTLSFFGYESIRLDPGDHYIGLMKILQKCPCLETLRFERGIILYPNYEEYERILNPVPPCFLSSLKTLEMLFVNGDDYPKLFMNAAKLLLERASFLDKFILYPSKFSGVDPMDKEKLIIGLDELPRASKVCLFEFRDFERKSI